MTLNRKEMKLLLDCLDNKRRYTQRKAEEWHTRTHGHYEGRAYNRFDTFADQYQTAFDLYNKIQALIHSFQRFHA